MKDNASAVVKSVAVAGCMMLCSAVNADGDIFVGTGETLEYDVASDSTLDVNLTVAPRGTFVKTGAGILTIPTSKIVQGWPANISVREGGVKIRAESTSSAVVSTVPPAAMQNAAVWFDSSEESSVISNPDGGISAWLDVRETGNATDGYGYVRAVTDNTITNLCPVISEHEGVKGVYFQGYGSGCWMNLRKPGDGQASVDAYNVFAVQGQFRKYGPLFGLKTASSQLSTLAFVPGNAGGVFCPLWTFYNLDIPAMHNARTYMDGMEVDAFTMSSVVIPTNRFSLLEVEFLIGPGRFQCFFNDRSYWNSTSVAGFTSGAGDRVGGEYICELVAFTNSLTGVERLQVEQYLIGKWSGAQRAGTIFVSTAEGASVELESVGSGVEAPDVKVSGAGDFIMQGADAAAREQMFTADGFIGRIVLKDGSAPIRNSVPYAAKSGQKVDVSHPYDGRIVTVSSAGAGVMVKTGNGDLRLNGVPHGVKRIDVVGGELTLESPHAVPAGMQMKELAVTGVVPNASFEIGIGSTTLTQHLGSEGFNGWHSVCEEDGDPSQLAWVNHSTYKGGMNDSSIYWNLPVAVPDGECVLAISKGATVWTTITLPQEGVYALTFMASARMNATKTGQVLEIAVGRSADTLQTVGYFRHPSALGRFTKYRYVLPRLEAGEHQLWFKCVDPALDKTSLFDDFRLTLIPDGDLRDVPNGSFELFKGAYDDLPEQTLFVKENFDALADWTIVQSDALTARPKTVSTYSYIGSGPVTPVMLSTNRSNGARTTPFYNMRESDDGMVQLYLQAGASASVTFTPAPGRYVLQADIGLWRCTQDFAIRMDALASVSVGEEEKDLGRIEIIDEYTLKPRRFPNAFTVDGVTPVTLKLRAERNWHSINQGYLAGQLLFDNVKLLSSSDTMSANLIADGSFATESKLDGTPWSCAASTNEPYTAKTIPCSSTSVQAYGANWHDGNYAAVIVDNSRIWQSVSFPAPGRHRLQVAARKRVSWGSATAKESCPVRFWIARNGVTNEIARFAPAVTNFTMYSWSFDVPEAGDDWLFCMEGLGATEAYPGNDMNTLLDGVSIFYAPLRSLSPDIPEDLEINVAEGSRLRLDYPGVCTVGRVRINGCSRSGIISAEEYPGAISGDGALYVQPKGTVITVR